MSLTSGRGAFEPFDIHTQKPATIEGIVSRNTAAYPVDRFSENVFKYVRKGHVKTDEHWTRNWKRAKLKQEGGVYVNYCLGLKLAALPRNYIADLVAFGNSVRSAWIRLFFKSATNLIFSIT